MATSPIELNRQFVRWTDEGTSDPDILRYVDALGASLKWPDLLQRRRVVVLAEAGSGKSTELEDRARRLADEGKYSFITTLQNIGRKGFERALGRIEWTRFEEWRASGEPAWVFLDSVDEAKRADFQLVDVLNDVATSIDGSEGRVHLVLSGRHSDWEFKRDLQTLLELVPLPPPDIPASGISPNEALIAAIRHEKPPEPPKPEEPLVVILASLDQARVEKFARAKGVTDADRFLAELQAQNLWSFVRRPTDLDWLVSYWRENGSFGTLAEMLEQSIVERLKEANPRRSRNDGLDVERARAALDRIGAALVLQRLDTIRIPDASLDLSENVPALDLDEVLPDWSSADRAELITRPIFDPASAGFVKLHNDNQGAVRGYLAACWLHRLRNNNCPWSRLADLLFADTYDVALVKPSMRATAAWLSLRDGDVAQEVVRRDPRLLMDAGDPGSLSLEARTATLTAHIDQIKDDDLSGGLDQDALRRFAKADMADFINGRWTEHGTSPAVRTLLLQLVWLGEIRACASIASAAAFGGYKDRYTQVFGGRALAAVGSDREKLDYVQLILDQVRDLPAVVVWDALESLFPAFATVADFLTIIDQIDPKAHDGGLGLDYHGPKLMARLTNVSDAARVVTTLLGRLKTRVDIADVGDSHGDEIYLDTLEGAGIRLLELSGPDEAPEGAIDAALRIGEERRFRGRSRDRDRPSVGELLRQTPIRRQAALWRAVEKLREQKLGIAEIESPWQLQILGFEPGLSSEDLPWLLADIVHRPNGSDNRFATNAAMQVWKQDGENAEILERIKAAANSSESATAVIEQWFAPPPRSEEKARFEREHRRHQRKSAVELAKRDQSWIDFAESLRSDPEQLRSIAAPTEAGVDSRLFHLWQLLSGLGDNRSHYAIRDLSPLRLLLGDAVVDELRKGFVAYWRRWKPILASERPAGEQNLVRSLDLIGIVGITQEAEGNPEWATLLSEEDAELAAKYATLELNGFPRWLDDLAKAHPTAVGNILHIYMSPDLHTGEGDGHRRALSDLASASDAVIATVAERIVAWLEAHDDAPLAVVDPALRIAGRIFAGQGQISSLAAARFRSVSNRHVRAAYLSAVYAEDPEQATTVLFDALSQLDEIQKVALVQAALPKIFGERRSRGTRPASTIPRGSLEQLVVMAFATIHPDADNDHRSGEVYSPDERDDAESARSALFQAMVEVPGLATYDSLGRLRDIPDFPVRERRLRELRRDRAEADSEAAPWRSQDVRAFEDDFESVPSTSADLQRIGISRLADLERHLLHGDFNQGLVVAELPHEVDVQNWFAEALRLREGRSYSLEREPHVVEEKEPDIRLQSRIAEARSPIEIKVAESCTLKQLEDALCIQLRDRYLRDRDNRFGVLLVVHQIARPRGWKSSDGWLSFTQVIQRLQAIAREMGAADAFAPQMAVCAVDVSGIPRPDRRRKVEAA